MSERLRAIGLWVGYTCFWVATRWPAIRENTLFYDDYGIPLAPAGFYAGSFRPMVLLEYRLWEWLVPGHFWTVLPKLTGAAYLGATGVALAFLLRRWGVPGVVAMLAPLAVLANPVLNDAGLWSSLHAIPLGLFFITLAAIAWDRAVRRPFLVAGALLLCGLLTYQIFVSLALVYIVAEPAIRRAAGSAVVWKDLPRKIGVTGAAAVLQMLYMETTRALVPHVDGRGFVRPHSLGGYVHDKLHGIFDLTVNGIMPVVAYYTGAAASYSLWRLVPLVIAGVGVMLAVVQRRRGLDLAIAAVFPIVIVFVPAVPVLLTSQSPYGWRVSSPVAIAVVLAVLPLVIRLGGPDSSRADRLAGPLILLLATALMVPVSFYEASMRVVSNRREAALMREIEGTWQARGVPRQELTLLYGPTLGVIEDTRLIGPHDLTWGYERRTPAMWTAFQDAWFADRFVANYHRLRFVDCSRPGAAPPCTAAVPLCATPSSDSRIPFPRIHYLDRGATLVCPGTVPDR